MRRYLSALAVALVALSGAARVWSVEQSTLAVVIGYDLDSTSFVYPIALGPTALPSTVIRPQAVEGWFERVAAPGSPTLSPRIKTATYDPSVESCVTNGAAFSPVSTGDLVQVNDKFNRPLYASIFEKTDANTVEFDRSVDLTQTGCASYRYRKVEAGTAIYDGWFAVAGREYTTIFLDVTQIVTSTSLGVDLLVECAANHALTAATVLASSNITVAGGYAVAIPEPWDVCRVGMKITNTDDDSTPATENEKISVYAIRR